MGYKILFLVEKFPWIKKMYMDFLSFETSCIILQEMVNNKIFVYCEKKSALFYLCVFFFGLNF